MFLRTTAAKHSQCSLSLEAPKDFPKRADILFDDLATTFQTRLLLRRRFFLASRCLIFWRHPVSPWGTSNKEDSSRFQTSLTG